ncbi:MAG TPA: recombination protein O N-terminal domain-containing protein [Candidatus Paceibacterota bacterium]|nr:recombination protein O N-terminal domain-containing protein [Candidatus Paceibacterota bacterium]
MSYAVYSTRGFILGSAPSGEASKLYSIYTEDFGLVRAKAQGVRLIQSKLRYGLEDYSFCALSLVRGREVWRVTGVQSLEAGDGSAKKGEALRARARVLNLVRRLVHGEEKNGELFDALTGLTKDDQAAEVRTLSLVLSALGYLDLKALEGKTERETVGEINRALKETQL